MKKVSILIPSHNRPITIKRTVDSIINQDYEGEIECLIVDSSDTNEVELSILEFQKSKLKPNRSVKFEKNPKNTYPIDNWILLSNMFNGDYVKFLCDDDWLEKKAIREMVNEIEKTDLSCVVTNLNIYLPENKKGEIKVYQNYYQLNRKIDIDNIVNAILRIEDSIPITQSASLLTKNVFKEAFDYSLKNTDCTRSLLGEDFLLNYFAAFKGLKVGFINESLTNSVASKDSLTANISTIKIYFCNILSVCKLASDFEYKFNRNQKREIRHVIFMYYLVKYLGKEDNFEFKNSTQFYPFPLILELIKYIFKKLTAKNKKIRN